ncbi:Aste57867_9364 [Aphanomyces stellatus]|uniref:Aste57867_9364 protein n=1 Tax=Aphanomyces stellatus TaxID=120398 RepID=A0A485KML8_9STRA|nr:hypothetical protein As57867_009328 [Aphanomyces stellatus]VFT86245.1 Aste57867_9364 [Aphanomyces stellatus]
MAACAADNVDQALPPAKRAKKNDECSHDDACGVVWVMLENELWWPAVLSEPKVPEGAASKSQGAYLFAKHAFVEITLETPWKGPNHAACLHAQPTLAFALTTEVEAFVKALTEAEWQEFCRTFRRFNPPSSPTNASAATRTDNDATENASTDSTNDPAATTPLSRMHTHMQSIREHWEAYLDDRNPIALAGVADTLKATLESLSCTVDVLAKQPALTTHLPVSFIPLYRAVGMAIACAILVGILDDATVQSSKPTTATTTEDLLHVDACLEVLMWLLHGLLLPPPVLFTATSTRIGALATRATQGLSSTMLYAWARAKLIALENKMPSPAEALRLLRTYGAAHARLLHRLVPLAAAHADAVAAFHVPWPVKVLDDDATTTYLTTEFGAGPLGLTMFKTATDDGHIRVSEIAGQAAEQGLVRVGDIVAAVNRKSVRNLSCDVMRAMLNASPRPVRMTFLRLPSPPPPDADNSPVLVSALNLPPPTVVVAESTTSSFIRPVKAPLPGEEFVVPFWEGPLGLRLTGVNKEIHIREIVAGSQASLKPHIRVGDLLEEVNHAPVAGRMDIVEAAVRATERPIFLSFRRPMHPPPKPRS